MNNGDKWITFRSITTVGAIIGVLFIAWYRVGQAEKAIDTHILEARRIYVRRDVLAETLRRIEGKLDGLIEAQAEH